MEDPDVVALFEREDTPTPPIEHITFFLVNEIVLAQRGNRRGMCDWPTGLFSFLARNALRPTTFFTIPTRRVMEIGSQILL